MKCSCGFGSECGVWCGNGHRNGQCPPYNANNDVRERIPPQCDYCGDYAPYGDERNHWIGYHGAWYHRLFYYLKRKLK